MAGIGAVVPFSQVVNVEVACERLRAKCEERAISEQVVADLALYVPPRCSPSKDTPNGDASITDLGDVDRGTDVGHPGAVMSWLNDESCQVLLLHGQSGSGKSLYVPLTQCNDDYYYHRREW